MTAVGEQVNCLRFLFIEDGDGFGVERLELRKFETFWGVVSAVPAKQGGLVLAIMSACEDVIPSSVKRQVPDAEPVEVEGDGASEYCALTRGESVWVGDFDEQGEALRDGRAEPDPQVLILGRTHALDVEPFAGSRVSLGGLSEMKLPADAGCAQVLEEAGVGLPYELEHWSGIEAKDLHGKEIF